MYICVRIDELQFPYSVYQLCEHFIKTSTINVKKYEYMHTLLHLSWLQLCFYSIIHHSGCGWELQFAEILLRKRDKLCCETFAKMNSISRCLFMFWKICFIFRSERFIFVFFQVLWKTINNLKELPPIDQWEWCFSFLWEYYHGIDIVSIPPNRKCWFHFFWFLLNEVLFFHKQQLEVIRVLDWTNSSLHIFIVVLKLLLYKNIDFANAGLFILNRSIGKSNLLRIKGNRVCLGMGYLNSRMLLNTNWCDEAVNF